MRKLTTFVHAHAVDDDGNIRSQVFGPGDKVPDWARKAITNPDVWEGEDDEIPEPVELSPVRLEHPKGNASRETWAAYAAQEGFQVEDRMTRDDIIATVDQFKE